MHHPGDVIKLINQVKHLVLRSAKVSVFYSALQRYGQTVPHVILVIKKGAISNALFFHRARNSREGVNALFHIISNTTYRYPMLA